MLLASGLELNCASSRGNTEDPREPLRWLPRAPPALLLGQQKARVSKQCSFFLTTSSSWLLAIESFLVALLRQDPDSGKGVRRGRKGAGKEPEHIPSTVQWHGLLHRDTGWRGHLLPVLLQPSPR